MNKELYNLKLNNKKITDIVGSEENYVEFVFEDGEKLRLEGLHDQDCCENVYADFSVLKYYSEAIKEGDFSQMVIKGVEGMGFLLCFLNGRDYEFEGNVKILVPCYNSQNGYYSGELRLGIRYGKINIEINISDFVEDHEG